MQTQKCPVFPLIAIALIALALGASSMIKKGQLHWSKGLVVSDTDRFYSLATR